MITSLTPITYKGGYVEIIHRYGPVEMASAIADIEQNGYEVVGEARGWGDNTAIVKDSYGGYNLARIEG